MLFFKLDYVLEMEQAGRREAAQCAARATRDARPEPGTLTHKLLGRAKLLADMYLKSRRRDLRKLAGVRLSESEARAVWPRLLEHKWYLSEQLGRDVGLRVAAFDFFENIEPPRQSAPVQKEWTPLPQLPMMLCFGERP